MKTYMICIIISLLLLGCVTPPPPNFVTTTTHTQQTTQTEITIPDIMNQLVEQGFRNINKSSRIALVNFATASPDMSDALLRTLEHTLVETGFIVVDRSELDRIRAEQNLQLSGDVDDNTAVSIGRFVGADVIVTGAIDALRQIGIRILNTQTAIVVGTSLRPLPANINIQPARQNVQITTQTTTTGTQTPSPATTTPTPTTQTPSQTTPPSTTSYRVGQIITFGQYRWRVLEVSENRVLIITEGVITNRIFDGMNNVWADSEIRRWLNGEFYNSFSATDRAKILQVNIPNPLVQHGVVPGPGTQDWIFLLSRPEAERYFTSNQDRIARNTSGNACFWWLRSPGIRSNYASYVNHYGYIDIHGHIVNDGGNGGVRPAMWIQP